MNFFLNLSSGLGLSGAAGLNAYIPLFFLSLLANRGVIPLAHPYDILGHTWCVVVLAILCLIELVIDKVPGIDHVNDLLQTVVRPTAGAILFASQMGVIMHLHPAVWIILGLLTAGSVHTAKTVARPAVNLSTLGIGGPVVSTIEDLISTVLSLLALLAPFFCLAAMLLLGFISWKLLRRLGNRRCLIPVETVSVNDAITPCVASSPTSRV